MLYSGKRWNLEQINLELVLSDLGNETITSPVLFEYQKK